MAFWEALRTTFAGIRAHWGRSLMTLIGVFLGTAAVVVMMSLIAAMKVMIMQGIEELGFDGVMFVSARAPEDALEKKKVTMSRGLSVRDIYALETWGESLKGVAALNMGQSVVKADGDERNVAILAVTSSYAYVRNKQIIAGRWIDKGDEIERRRVAVLGQTLAEALYGKSNPIGRTIRVGDQQLRVVGVIGALENPFIGGGGFLRREANGVYVPLITYRTYFRGGERVGVLMVKTENKDDLKLVAAEVERLIRRSHHGIGDFHVENIADEMIRAEKEINKIIKNWGIVFGAIAGISLLVGGVGIYSVMKISLAERLYEIGLRKAIGAPDRAILAQFLLESITLSVLGGLVGLLVGGGLCALFSKAFPTGLPLSPFGATLGLGFAIGVGFFAGIFPSISAARLTPVDALRG